MKLQNTKKGFTLIELLVVITIIGILATGATTVFTSQIQKARDATRITSLNAIRGVVEQVYQDNYAYPKANEFLSDSVISVKTYLQSIPKDPKNGQNCNNLWNTDKTVCGIAYKAAEDSNTISLWSYELSISFENSWNVSSKAINTADNWNDTVRYEIWLDQDIIDTDIKTSEVSTNENETSWACLYSWWAAGDQYDLIIINGDWNCSYYSHYKKTTLLTQSCFFDLWLFHRVNNFLL